MDREVVPSCLEAHYTHCGRGRYPAHVRQVEHSMREEPQANGTADTVFLPRQSWFARDQREAISESRWTVYIPGTAHVWVAMLGTEKAIRVGICDSLTRTSRLLQGGLSGPAPKPRLPPPTSRLRGGCDAHLLFGLGEVLHADRVGADLALELESWLSPCWFFSHGGGIRRCLLRLVRGTMDVRSIVGVQFAVAHGAQWHA